MAKHTTPRRRRKEKVQATVKNKLAAPSMVSDRNNLHASCHKCGRIGWVPQPEPLTWGCLYCGNRVFYTHGVLQQQIDSVMNSGRKGEYVRSVDGKTISAKRNEDIKRILFRDNLEKEQARKAKEKARAGLTRAAEQAEAQKATAL